MPLSIEQKLGCALLSLGLTFSGCVKKSENETVVVSTDPKDCPQFQVTQIESHKIAFERCRTEIGVGPLGMRFRRGFSDNDEDAQYALSLINEKCSIPTQALYRGAYEGRTVLIVPLEKLYCFVPETSPTSR